MAWRQARGVGLARLLLNEWRRAAGLSLPRRLHTSRGEESSTASTFRAWPAEDGSDVHRLARGSGASITRMDAAASLRSARGPAVRRERTRPAQDGRATTAKRAGEGGHRILLGVQHQLGSAAARCSAATSSAKYDRLENPRRSGGKTQCRAITHGRERILARSVGARLGSNPALRFHGGWRTKAAPLHTLVAKPSKRLRRAGSSGGQA